MIHPWPRCPSCGERLRGFQRVDPSAPPPRPAPVASFSWAPHLVVLAFLAVLTLFLVVVVLLGGCGPAPGSEGVRLGGAHRGSPAFAPRFPGSSILVNPGPVEVLPPPFMASADWPVLIRAMTTYHAEAVTALGWSPPVGMVVAFRWGGLTFGTAPPTGGRVYVLDWPLGARGQPRATQPAPEWGMAVVQDYRMVNGRTGQTLTSRELDAIYRCRALPVVMQGVSDPTRWDW